MMTRAYWSKSFITSILTQTRTTVRNNRRILTITHLLIEILKLIIAGITFNVTRTRLSKNVIFLPYPVWSYTVFILEIDKYQNCLRCSVGHYLFSILQPSYDRGNVAFPLENVQSQQFRHLQQKHMLSPQSQITLTSLAFKM